MQTPPFSALRAAIADNPDDLGLRRVFADLLTERGDPRGLFIEAQCQGNEELARSLLERYRHHLLHPLPKDAQVVFRNGFVEAWTTTPWEFQKAGRRMFRQSPLRALCLVGAREVEVRYLLATPGVGRLCELELLDVRSAVLQLLSRASLPALRKLVVTGFVGEAEERELRASPLGAQLQVFSVPQRTKAPSPSPVQPAEAASLSSLLWRWATRLTGLVSSRA